MPCVGGAAVVVANTDVAKRSRNRPVWIKGFGEHVPFKTPTYAQDLLQTPITKAADTAFGMAIVADHDLTFRGDFPLNTAGGQLGFGQAGLAGGMHHVCDATRQIMGRAGEAQVPDCHRAFVSGNGGILSEQTTLILEGD